MEGFLHYQFYFPAITTVTVSHIFLDYFPVLVPVYIFFLPHNRVILCLNDSLWQYMLFKGVYHKLSFLVCICTQKLFKIIFFSFRGNDQNSVSLFYKLMSLNIVVTKNIFSFVSAFNCFFLNLGSNKAYIYTTN